LEPEQEPGPARAMAPVKGRVLEPGPQQYQLQYQKRYR
jgi:hypothetical protein